MYINEWLTFPPFRDGGEPQTQTVENQPCTLILCSFFKFKSEPILIYIVDNELIAV